APNGVVNFLLDTDVEWLASPALALGTVTFINIWAGYPFFMVSLLAGLQGVPAELHEAATVDGANGWQRFWSVTIPQLRPIIISLTLLDLIWTSQQFALIWMTTGGGPVNVTEMLSTYTYKLAFSRFDFPGKKPINMVIVSVQAVPPITLLIPYFGIVVGLGLYNTYPGLILTYMVFTLPYAIIMLTGYLNTIPKELDEAVRVDGAGSLTALWRVLVPVSVPGIVSVGVYTFMIAWNEYLFALTLTRTQDMRTVPIGIQLLMGQHSYEWNEIMAMSILGSIPVLVLFLFFQRYFISGLTSGSVKS
ncbi:ABC transporter permease subunit, partial [Streptomyces griseoincarnatus]